MWWAMAASAGFSLLGSSQKNSTAADNRALTEYQNRMRLLSNAANQNTLTQNENIAIQESVQESINIQKNSIRAQGMATVSAAAAGVTGISVGQALLDITRDSAEAEQTRQFNMYKDFANISAQRESSRQGVINSLDLRTHSGAGLGEIVFDAGKSAFGTWLNYV